MRLRNFVIVAAMAAATAACSQSGYQNMDSFIELGGTTVWHDSLVARAEADDPLAQRMLGNMYYWGERYEQSDQKAFVWWRRAAQNGDETASEFLRLAAAGQPVEGALNGGIGRQLWSRTEEVSEKAWVDIEKLEVCC